MAPILIVAHLLFIILKLMKNKIILSILFSLLIISQTGRVYSQGSQTTAAEVENDSGVENALEKNAQILKDKIATKVAELAKKADTVVSGMIVNIDNDGFALEQTDKNKINVTTDEVLTSYRKAGAKPDTIERSELEKDDYVVVSGSNLEGEIAANLVYLQKPYLVLTGQITSVDSDAFQLEVVTTDKSQYQLDFEKGTVGQIMSTSDLELSKVGFSKLKVGDNVHFTVEDTGKEEKSYSLLRILIIPQEYFTDETDSS